MSILSILTRCYRIIDTHLALLPSTCSHIDRFRPVSIVSSMTFIEIIPEFIDSQMRPCALIDSYTRWLSDVSFTFSLVFNYFQTTYPNPFILIKPFAFWYSIYPIHGRFCTTYIYMDFDDFAFLFFAYFRCRTLVWLRTVNISVGRRWWACMCSVHVSHHSYDTIDHLRNPPIILDVFRPSAMFSNLTDPLSTIFDLFDDARLCQHPFLDHLQIISTSSRCFRPYFDALPSLRCFNGRPIVFLSIEGFTVSITWSISQHSDRFHIT